MAAVSAIAIAGLAITAATTAKSFADANKQKKLQNQASLDAAKAMAEAKKKLDVNYYDDLTLNEEAYEMEANAMLAAGAQVMEAGATGDRGAASVAGRVYAGQSEAQRKIASQKAKDLLALEKLSATEDDQIGDKLGALQLAEAQGAQLAERDAQESYNRSIEQGIGGVGDLAAGLYADQGLYDFEGRSPESRAEDKAARIDRRNRRRNENLIETGILDDETLFENS